MTNTTCLQFVVNGMNDKIFTFAKTKDGNALVRIFKKWGKTRDEQIKELLIGFNSYYMVQAGMMMRGMPKHPRSIIEFMTSEEFSSLHDELTKTVQDNYQLLVNCLTKKQRRKLEALF
jgi:predicted DNA-binding protein (MmcQ/YjbR family)